MPSASIPRLQGLLDRYNAGEAAAREQFSERACERLRRLARKVFPDDERRQRFEEAADGLPRVLVRLRGRLEKLSAGDAPVRRPPANVREFFQLASREIRHAFLDLVRHYYGAGSQRRQATQIAPSTPDADSPAPGSLGYWTEFHKQIGVLPAEEREVFELRWYQGLSTEACADVLGVSLATAKRRWMAARLLLQAVLESGGATERGA